MKHQSTEPASDQNTPDNADAVGPLVWHPWIRALGWVKGWAFFSISAATVWEFTATGSLHIGPTLARGGAILFALALLTAPFFLLDLWIGLWMHALHNYERRYAALIFALESIPIVAVLAPYLWFARWIHRLVWARLSEWGARFPPDFVVSGPLPGWFVVLVLLAGAAIFVGMRRAWGQVASIYTNATQLLGFKRTVRGVLLMSFLRMRLPRRDFFLHCPVISWMPVLAVCVILHVVLEQSILRWLIPGVLLFWFLAMWLELIAPPTWLFLGKSDFQSFAAFETMRRTWRQHGLTLLDRVGTEGTLFYSAWRQTHRLPSAFFFDPSAPRTWSLRTRPELWEHTVLLLMDFVLVVVVDMRGDSDIVRDELTWLAQPGRIEKAWYLVANGEQGATLDYEHVYLPRGSRLVTEQMLFSAEWSPTGLRVGPAASL